jgi:hypothetical protein
MNKKYNYKLRRGGGGRGEIGARWQLIRMNTNVRRVTEPAEYSRTQEVRAVHLECDTQAAQYVKHKVAHVIKLLISR